MNKKIDIFVNGKYSVSTNQSKTCKQAIEKYKFTFALDLNKKDKVTAYFSK